MPIQYSLVQNTLSNDQKHYVARVKPVFSVNLPGLVDRIVEKGSTVGRADALAVLEDTVTVCESLIVDGHRVNFGGMVEIYAKVKGKFEGPQDNFDTARHQLDVGARSGRRIRQAVRADSRTEKIEASSARPAPNQYTDAASGTMNERMTPGNIGKLSGSRLQFDSGRDDEGVFLVQADTQESRRLGQMATNRPRQLIFLVPADLPKGRYVLEVRARGRDSETVRMGRIQAELTV